MSPHEPPDLAAPVAPAAPGAALDALRSRLLALVAATLRDLQGDAFGGPPTVTPDSVLDRDLGLDSLARMELLLRIERTFGVDLPEDTLQRSETVGDLLRVLGAAAPTARAVPPVAASLLRREDADGTAAPAAPAGMPPGGESPELATTLVEVLDWHCRRHPPTRCSTSC